MYYYKFRPPSEVFYKELLYNELFFSDPDECNDPYDSKTFFSFSNNLERWEKLLEFTVADFNNVEISKLLKNMAPSFCNLSPLNFDDIENHELLELLPPIRVRGNHNTELSLSDFVKLSLLSYKPPINYFVSYSKTNNEPLLWSHYADSHKGYCLIFKAINGKLKQGANHIKKSVNLQTPFGIIAPNTSFGLPEEFPFQPISYSSEIKSIDAFTCFPEQVWNEKKEDIDPIAFFKNRNQNYLEKANGWAYEQESRIILSQPAPWMFKMHYKFSHQERLFHFEPSQLVGIILGARIDKSSKLRISEIIKEYQYKLAQHQNYKRTIFDFVIFQSYLSSNRREMKIIPETIFSFSNSIDRKNPEFEAKLSQWNDGWGLEFEGNGCRRNQII